jgi:cystathionine beta-lyase
MLFLDCEEWCKKHNCTLEELEKKGWRVGVAWQDGAMFKSPWSIRMNLALPLSRVQEAMNRLGTYVFTE